MPWNSDDPAEKPLSCTICCHPLDSADDVAEIKQHRCNLNHIPIMVFRSSTSIRVPPLD